MAPITLTISTHTDQVFPVEVDPSAPVTHIKNACEAETGLPAAQQVLLFNGQPLQDTSTVGASGLVNGDLLMLLPVSMLQRQQQPARGSAAQASAAPQQAGGRQVLEQLPDGSMKNPVAAMQQIRADRATMTSLQASNPRLAAAVENEDIEAFQEELRRTYRAKRHADNELESLYRQAEEDPFNVEVQRKIEELIQQKNVDEAYQHTLENNPEFLVSVHMLYVDMEANGVHVKAFVDSGAQMTIMTQEFAQKCHLMHMLDRRFTGVARGVGQSTIVGRIHQAQIKVKDRVMTTSITVLEQKHGPQFIFGLDMLKRHRCCIDLAKNVLHIGSVDVDLPFLPEHQIPSDFHDHIEEGVSQQEAAQRMSTAGGSSAGAPSTATPQEPSAAPSSSNPHTAVPASASAAASAPVQTPASAVAAAPSQAATAGSGAVTEDKVQTLVGLGMTRDMAVAALQQANGNVDLAASLMFMD